MAIDARLTLGLEAYQRGDLESAIARWERLTATFDDPSGDEATLTRALVHLSRGLALATRSEDTEATEAELLRCQESLSRLPNRVLGVDVPLLRAGCHHGLDRLLVTPPPVLVARRFPPGTGRFVAFMALLLAAALILRFTPLQHYLDREVAVELLQEIRGSIWAPVALLLAFIVLAPLGAPISPIILAGGAVFGLTKGVLLNHLGSVLGGTLGYQLARLLGRDFVAGIAGRKLRRVEAIVSRHGFWSLAGMRLMPIPYPVANFGLALAGVRLPMFILSTAIGLIPGIVMYTYLATVLTSAAEGTGESPTLRLVTAILIFTLVGLSPALWQQRKRKLRYARLRKQRADRESPGPASDAEGSRSSPPRASDR